MVNYEIKRVDANTLQAWIVYTKEGHQPFHHPIGLGEGFTEADVHAAAKSRAHVEAACHYWSRDQLSVDITETTGQTKTVVLEPQPEYNFSTHYAEETVTETDEEIIVGWTIWERSEESIAADVRRRRDDLLRMTDAWGFQDRNMTPEMAAYRQALRDIPQQEGFPHTVTWPIQPID